MDPLNKNLPAVSVMHHGAESKGPKKKLPVFVSELSTVSDHTSENVERHICVKPSELTLVECAKFERPLSPNKLNQHFNAVFNRIKQN